MDFKKYNIILVFAIVFFSSYARAEHIPSERYGAFELKFGPYKPDLKNEGGLSFDPYNEVFGNDKMFLTVIEFDWQFARVEGVSFAIGGQAGFMQNYTQNKNLAGEKSADYSVLNIIPFALLGVIRIDVLNEKLKIPIVPYFKIGFNWYLWWILSGGEKAKFTDPDTGKTTKASGGTMGWQMNTGIMFCLDPLDKMTARTFDNEAGVNHSYLFFELLYADVDKFNKPGYMVFSDITYLIGIAVEF